MSVNVYDYASFDKSQYENSYDHLEIGAANYGEDSNAAEQDSSYKSISDLQHKLLMDVGNFFMEQNKERKKIVFYLNDYSQKGLEKAANVLKKHFELDKKYSGVDIAIVKIYADVHSFNNWPNVESANILNPCLSVINSKFLYRIGQSNVDDKEMKLIMPNIILLNKIAAISKSGVYVSDPNASSMWEDRFNYSLKNNKEFVDIEFKKLGFSSLKFKKEEIKEFSYYYFPNGSPHQSSGCGPKYRITVVPTDSNESRPCPPPKRIKLSSQED